MLEPASRQGKTEDISLTRQVTGFVVTGGIAAILYILLASSLVAWLGLAPWLSSVMAHAVMIPVAYLGQRTISFASRASHRHAFPRYVVVQCVGLVMAAILVQVLHSVWHMEAKFAFSLTAVATSLATFVAIKAWVFWDDGDQSEASR